MRIVPDANVICADPHMEGSAWRVLSEAITRLGHSLHVPRLVIDEAVNWYREEIRSHVQKTDRPLKQLGRLLQREFRVLQDDEINRAVDDCRARMERKFSDLGEILPYPATHHEGLVRRDLFRKKPFGTSGRGYRDALIWESVLILAEQGNQVVAFVSENTKDFSDGKGQFHQDLIEDAAARGVPDRVRLFTSLDAFVEREITPLLEGLNVIKDALNAKAFENLDLESWLHEEFQNVVSGKTWDASSLWLRDELESPTIASVQDITSIEVQDVRRLPSGELYIDFQADLECEFDVFLLKSSYYVIDDRDLPSIVDWNWNDHYMLGAVVIPVTAEISITFDRDRDEVTSAQVRDVYGHEPRLEG